MVIHRMAFLCDSIKFCNFLTIGGWYGIIQNVSFPVRRSAVHDFKMENMIYIDDYLSPCGEMRLACDGDALIGLWFKGQNVRFDSMSDDCTRKEKDLLKRTKDWLDRYFCGLAPDPCQIKIRPQGSGFSMRVWELLLEIPYGVTTTYGEIAKQIARERGIRQMSAQAVGRAIGANPISIIIPCHRVIGAGGTLVGYSGGLEKKRYLLCLEGHNM